MTATAMPGTGRRHRVVAIGSGFGGLTATKALKHDLVNITDVVAFLTRFTAQGTAHVHNHASLWLHVIPTTAAVFTTVGVLITLYVAFIRGRRSCSRYAIASAAAYFTYNRRLGHSRRVRKGWR